MFECFSIFIMRSAKSIVAVILASTIMVAPALDLTGGAALEYVQEAEVEETPDGAEWAHSCATRPASRWAATSKNLFNERSVAARCRVLLLDRLHILLI